MGGALGAVNGVEQRRERPRVAVLRLGAGAALYWTQPGVRDAINQLVVAVKNVIL